MKWLVECWRSSIGGKVTMAVTGLLLFGFVVGHLLGNLQLLAGPEPLNRYAAFLKGSPVLLWSARVGLFVVFVLHVATGIRLARENRAARPVGYAKSATVQATLASRSMVLTGLTTLAFVVYHLLHFTVGAVHSQHFSHTTMLDGETVHDVHRMVVESFSSPLVAGCYLASQIVLFFHLAHGVQSLVQTLGISHDRYTPMIRTASLVLAALIAGGNICLVLSVLTGIVEVAA